MDEHWHRAVVFHLSIVQPNGAGHNSSPGDAIFNLNVFPVGSAVSDYLRCVGTCREDNLRRSELFPVSEGHAVARPGGFIEEKPRNRACDVGHS